MSSMTNRTLQYTKLMQLNGFNFEVRPDTTDEKVIPEVVGRNNYRRKGFLSPVAGETWFDLGANIGAFSVWALGLGVRHIYAYEPHPDNVTLLRRNLQHNGWQNGEVTIHAAAITYDDTKTMPLYVCKGEANKYRHTLRPVRGRQQIDVHVVSLLDELNEHVPDGVKMDVEGSEMAMLDNAKEWLGSIRKLCLEYHFDVDRKVANFHERIENLRNVGFDVWHQPVPDVENYPYFPAARMVFAHNKSLQI